jgi:hypothetical protein
MNHDYQTVAKTFAEQEIDESYIEKALYELGFDKFPKSGLEDSGLIKLVETATDIYHSEAQLVKRKPKKGYLPTPKIKREKQKNSGDLEFQIIKEEFKKVGKVSKKILKGITYCTAGAMFANPTIARKIIENCGDETYIFVELIGTVIESGICLYWSLAETNPKLIPYVFGTQIATNIASGIYEYVRHVKTKAKRLRENPTEQKELDCSP